MDRIDVTFERVCCGVETLHPGLKCQVRSISWESIPTLTSGIEIYCRRLAAYLERDNRRFQPNLTSPVIRVA